MHISLPKSSHYHLNHNILKFLFCICNVRKIKETHIKTSIKKQQQHNNDGTNEKQNDSKQWLSSNLRVRNGALVLAAGVASPDGLSRTWQSLHRARGVCYAALGYKGFSIINCSFVPLEEYLFEVDCKFKFRTNICTNTLHSPSALIIQTM